MTNDEIKAQAIADVANMLGYKTWFIEHCVKPSPESEYTDEDKAIAALVAQREQNIRLELERKWQPIETAPKDGSVVIGLWRGLAYSIHWQPYYYEKWPPQEGGPTYRYQWSAETWDQHMPCNPTHWMPMPEKE